MIPGVIALASQLVRERADLAQRELAMAAELERAELRLLQLQLQPHFLFNALHAVSALMATDVAAAGAMLAALDELLRASLEQLDVQELPLRDELALLGKYVDFQRARYRDRLVVRTDVAKDTMDAHVPTLLLQPLVENAIQHTVERTSRQGTVQVSAARRGDELHVGVRDDGPGFGATGHRPVGGVGLANTRRRLEQLHGARHRLELLDVNGTGALVRIVIPFRTAAAA
ncbi:MAG: sensor histidine kinase [Longimicrobiales bacterium]